MMSNPFRTEEIANSKQSRVDLKNSSRSSNTPTSSNIVQQENALASQSSPSLEPPKDLTRVNAGNEATPRVYNLSRADYASNKQNRHDEFVDPVRSALPSHLKSPQLISHAQPFGDNQASHSPVNPRVSRNLDVGSFTSLLMKGIPGPAEATSSSKSAINNSSAEQAATSKEQSDIPQGLYSELDRHDRAELLEGSKSHRLSKVPPPPPKSRHGRTLHDMSKGPQVVPFDHFSTTESDVVSGRTAVDSLISPREFESLDLKSSYLHDSEPGTSVIRPESENVIASPPINDSKRAPPPLPLSRRSTVSKRPKANAVSSMTPQSDELSKFSSPNVVESTDSFQRDVPVPPRSRRSISGNLVPNQTIASPDDSVKERCQDIRNNYFSQGRMRSSSGASINSSQPPPPPPRRKSSRASIESNSKLAGQPGSASHSRRTSVEISRSSIDSQRWLPHSSKQFDGTIAEEAKDDYTSVTSDGQNPSRSSVNNVLEDMEEFQREIDSLRAKYK